MNITITKATFRNQDLIGVSAPLVSAYKPLGNGQTGGYITVDGKAVEGLPNRRVRIMLDSEHSYTFSDGSSVPASTEVSTSAPAAAPVPTETDEEIIERLRYRFNMLNDMTRAAKKGKIRAMIVSGPPGIGKSHGVETVLGKGDLISTLSETAPKYEVVKGAMSPLGLYAKLYEFRHSDNVIVFDDCDSVLLDDLALNLLKAALDSKKTRSIHWHKDSYKLKDEDIPNVFDFEGSAIFITNIKFDNVKSKRLKDHLEALESRCHYMDLTIDTQHEKMLRIKQIVKDGMLNDYSFGADTAERIVEFVDENKNKLRELSLRTILKTADLADAFPTRWEGIAENTIMKR